jgi:hypothetical protein
MTLSTKIRLKHCIVLCLILSPLAWLRAQETGATPAWLQVSNQLSVSAEYYSVKGIDGRQLPMTYILQGAPTVQIGSVPVPFSFVLSSFSNSYQTPFNQMGTSPKYKWIQVHAGYRNMNYSSFTLGGQRMLGIGVDLTPGKFQCGFFWGVIRRAIEPDSSLTMNPPPGSLFYGPGYKRTGFGAKIGFGDKGKSQFSLSMFKAGDIQGSLDEIYRTQVKKPEENLVLGMNWKVQFSEHLSWISDIAFSAYTRNTAGDSVDISDFAYASTLNNIFTPMNSSQYLTALETGLLYQGKNFKTYLKYRRIDPDFKSMGIYFINSDLQEYSINPSIRLGTKLSFSGALGLQHDNLLGNKERTTERVIYRGSLDWNPNTRFSIGLQHSNFGITQNALAPNIADTTLLRQINTTYGISPRLTFRNDRLVQMVMVNVNYQELSNAFSGAFAPPDVSTLNCTGVYSWNLIKHAVSVNPGVAFVEVSSSQFTTKSIGGSLSVSTPLRFVPVSAMAQSAIYMNTVDDVKGGSTMNHSLQLNYKMKNGMSFQAGAQYLKNEGTPQSVLPGFTEIRLKAGFTWNVSTSIKKKSK